MQGGINNAGLFGASQREARSKLDQMAGIKRPSGILASSPELMRAAMPTPMAPAPVPMAAPAPMAMPMAPAPAPMPMPTTVSAAPTPAPAPRSLNPMAQDPAGQQPVVKLNQGGEPLKGYSDMGARLAEKAKASVAAGGSPVVDITQTSIDFVQNMDNKTGGAVTEQFGSVEAAAKEGTRKANIIESAAAATDDPSKVADAVLVAAGEQPTEAAKMDFAENVFGLEDVNDIDEINRRIANVAIGGSVAKSPEEFTQAVLLGLQAYKQTATARAAAKSGGGKSGMSPLEPFPDAVRDLAGKIMTATGEEASVAIKQAQEALAPYYTGQAGPTSSAPPPAAAPTDGGLPAVSTQAEYDALPSGAEFVQNGQKRKKP
jgi:hypothetical protein